MISPGQRLPSARAPATELTAPSVGAIGYAQRTEGVSPEMTPDGAVGSAFRLATILVLLSLMALTASVPAWSVWSVWSILLVGVFTSWMLRRRSVLVALYLAQVALYYGVTRLLQGDKVDSEVASLVLLWIAGISCGALLRRRRQAPTSGVSHAVRSGIPHAFAVAGFLALQAILFRSGQAGFRSQLSGGVSTPTGLVGAVAVAGPLLTVAFVVVNLRRNAMGRVSIIYVAAQSLILASSGFRGAGIVFLIALATTAAIYLPVDSRWRRPRLMALAAVALPAAFVATFGVGSMIRNAVAADLGVQSRGTQPFGFSDAVEEVSLRLDLGSSLTQAVEVADLRAVQNAVDWSDQLLAVVPRAIWPDKPVLDYGQRVSITAYGSGPTTSSSTLTTIGDAFINFGTAGVLLLSLAIGYAVCAAEAVTRIRSGIPGLVITGGLAVWITDHEGGVILSTIGTLQMVIVVFVAWRVCDIVGELGDRRRVDLNASRRD